MGNTFNSPGDYRIEVSGWGLDNGFFLERTDLLWTNNGEKQLQLHRALPEGAIVFVRLLNNESSKGSVPVAYRVTHVVPMDCNGRCQMGLAQLHPRSRESSGALPASDSLEELGKRCDAEEGDTQQHLLQEEVAP